jgi:MFS transporter, ACS family, glucarate transporter
MSSRPSSLLDVSRPTGVRWLIFYLACASSGLLYLHRYSWGVIKPYLKEDYPDLNDTQLGWLDSAFNATYAIGQVPSGAAGDLLGPRIILTGSVLLWTLMVAATALVYGFWLVVAVRGVFGFAQAGAYPILGQLTRHWFPRQVRTGVQGMIAASGRLGGAAASLIVATLLMGWLGLSWRAALLVLAVPGFLLAFVVWLIVRLGPREHPWANPAEERLVAEPETVSETISLVPPGKYRAPSTEYTEIPPDQRKTEDPAQPEPPSKPASIRFHLTPAALITFGMLLLYSFVSTFADMLYVFWIPSFLVEGRGFDKTQMGLFATLPLLGGAAGGVVGGLLNDALYRLTGNRRWSRSGVACTGKLLAAALMAASFFVADGRLAMLVLLVCKFFCDWSQPTQWGTITDIGGRASATLFGVVNTVGNLGAFAAGVSMGYWKQQHGWEGLFLGVAVIYLGAAICWLFIDCTRKLVT